MGRKLPLPSGRKPDIDSHGSRAAHPDVSLWSLADISKTSRVRSAQPISASQGAAFRHDHYAPAWS
jgi:hypothetical protein